LSGIRREESLPRFLKGSMPKRDLFSRGSCFPQLLMEVRDRKIVKSSLSFSPLVNEYIDFLFSNLFVKTC